MMVGHSNMVISANSNENITINKSKQMFFHWMDELWICAINNKSPKATINIFFHHPKKNNNI